MVGYLFLGLLLIYGKMFIVKSLFLLFKYQFPRRLIAKTVPKIIVIFPEKKSKTKLNILLILNSLSL